MLYYVNKDSWSLIRRLLASVFIHLYSASCSAHQSEALPMRETPREESSLERTKRGTWFTSYLFTSKCRVFNLFSHLQHRADGANVSLHGFSACLVQSTQLPSPSAVDMCLPSCAIIHSIPKVEGPSKPADYRPILVVSVLCRIVERQLVRQYLYPSFLIPAMLDLLVDQFVFWSTGSTVAAVNRILHDINEILAVDYYASHSTLPRHLTLSFSLFLHVNSQL